MRTGWSRYTKLAVGVAIGIAAGAWVGACNSVLDAGRFMFGSCNTAGDRRCTDNVLEVCSANGAWTGGEPCKDSACDAVAGKCVGECAPGSLRCSPGGESSFQACDSAGQWGQETGCLHACFQGACTVCVPGIFGCSVSRTDIKDVPVGDWQIFCDEQGVWEAPQMTPCNCVGGVCSECKPGQMGCNNGLQITCDDTGHWPTTGGVACEAGTFCDDAIGQCVLPCKVPDTKCNGTTEVWTCNDMGTWDISYCPNPCEPCNSQKGKCEIAQGAPCTANCVTEGTCGPTGVCEPVPGGSVICADAGDTLCNANTCDPMTGRCSVPNHEMCNSGDLCNTGTPCFDGVCAGSSPADHAWAHWSFKAAAPPKRFEVTEHVVYDNVTHLMWQRTPSDLRYMFTDASSPCECLNDADGGCAPIPGYPHGWRLPTRIELMSIVMYEQSSLLDQQSFNLSPAGFQFWTTSTKNPPSGGSSSWTVNFTNGMVTPEAWGTMLAVRCVR